MAHAQQTVLVSRPIAEAMVLMTPVINKQVDTEVGNISNLPAAMGA